MNALALLRRFWPVLIVLALGLWAARLDHLRADYRQTLTNERAAWSATIASAEQSRLSIEARNARQLAAAAERYAASLADRQPIILRSRDTVTRYAQTDAGRALCLAADRVRGAAADRAALFAEPANPSEGGQRAVPPGSPDNPS